MCRKLALKFFLFLKKIFFSEGGRGAFFFLGGGGGMHFWKKIFYLQFKRNDVENVPGGASLFAVD